MQTPEPQEQHQWLLQLVGEWEFEHECNVIEIIDRDHHTMTSQFVNSEGQWTRFMLGTYRRSK